MRSPSFPWLSHTHTHSHERHNNKGVTTYSTTIRNMEYLNTIVWFSEDEQAAFHFLISTIVPAPLLFTHPGCVSDLNVICSAKLGHNLCMSARLADVRSQAHQPENNHLRLLYCPLSSLLKSVFPSNPCLHSFQR